MYRRNQIWWYSYVDANGKRRRVSSRSKSKSVAEAKFTAAKALTEAESIPKEYGDKILGKVTFECFANIYAEWAQYQRTWKVHTS